MKVLARAQRSLRKKVPHQSAWSALGALLLIGLFFWSTLQTQRLDELRSERFALEEECAYLEQLYRDAQQEWFAESSLERVIPRAKAELGLVDASPHSRTVIAVAPAPTPGRATAWLADLASRFDRFGEIRSAHADEGGR